MNGYLPAAVCCTLAPTALTSQTPPRPPHTRIHAQAGLDDESAVRDTGARFRDTVLALGGSVPPAEVFKRFRGREPSTKPLLQHNGLLAAATA